MNTHKAVALSALTLSGLLLAGCGDEPTADPTASERPTVSSPTSTGPSAEPTSATPTPSKSPSGTTTPSTTALPVYYLGDTQSWGPRLFREFVAGDGQDKVAAAVSLAVSGRPADPDYRTAWPTVARVTVEPFAGDVLTISLEGDPAALRKRPADLTRREAQVSIQQVVFTAQAALGQGRVPVQLLLNGAHTDLLLGQPVAEPLANDSVLAVCNHMNITVPAQGQVVDGSRPRAVSGVSNGVEASVYWRLERDGTIVLDGPTTADGWMENRLFPWSATIDISGLPPGDYTRFATTDDPSGGEGRGPATDDKSFTIR